MVDPGAVEAARAFDFGEVIADSGGEQEFAAAELGSIVENHDKTLRNRARCGNMVSLILNVVARHLLARDTAKLRRVDTVTGEEAVNAAGGFVTVVSVIENYDAPPRASEDRRRA
jgi:hypothetical protein